MTVFAFGNNLSPTNLLTLCKNDVVHNTMSNAQLLITQQRHRRKTQNNRAAVCVPCVCYTEACAAVCVCILQKIDAGRRCWQISRKSKLSTLLSQGILCPDSKGPIKKKREMKRKAWCWQLKSQTLSDGAFLAVSDQRHGWSQTVTASKPTTSLVSEVVPTSEQDLDGWRDDIGRLWTPPPQTRGDAICT